jgi:hypothetical protein
LNIASLARCSVLGTLVIAKPIKGLPADFRRINKESVVNGDAQGSDKPICLCCHTDDSDHLGLFLIGHTLRASAGCVRMNAVGATETAT